MDDIYLYVLYAAFAVYSLLLAAAAALDTWKFVIPNALNVALVALFVATALALPFETAWLEHIGAALAVFAGGAILFALNKMGGGDVKLLTAVALWAGFDHLVDFLLYVTLSGGALALVFLVGRRVIMSVRVARSGEASTILPRLLLEGEAIPYGLAIGSSGIALGFSLPHLGAYLSF